MANGGLALLRVFAGLAMALQHGIGKIPPSDGFIAGVQKLGFPLAEGFAWAAGTSEFLGGLLLALGLLTRPAAACVAGTMAVAAFGRHAADPFQNKELALLYLGVALLFVALGAGRYGVDAFLRRDERV
ncbi:MAG: DoxX family protein [bacterium]|nr:DoxX family protein [bacterium]